MGKRQPDGSITQKPTFAQNVGAALAGIAAAKIAAYAVTTVWRLATREEPPQIDQRVSALKKAVWLGTFAAATGIARQTVHDLIKPPVEGPA